MPRLGVLGWPVAHSRSPAMHNAAFAALGLAPDWRYQHLPVPPELLAETVRALPGAGFVRTFADVTALVETNTRLQRSEAQARKLALVASHTDDAVLITDSERRIEWVNESFTPSLARMPRNLRSRRAAMNRPMMGPTERAYGYSRMLGASRTSGSATAK